MGDVRPKRDIDAALRKKGFQRDEDADHIKYHLVGFPRIRTMMSHGSMSTTIGADLISRMSRQLHLTKKQFLDLIDCTLDEDGYCLVNHKSWDIF